jgi:hypothetical protein
MATTMAGLAATGAAIVAVWLGPVVWEQAVSARLAIAAQAHRKELRFEVIDRSCNTPARNV